MDVPIVIALLALGILLDKYDELLPPVSTLFTSAFGDQLVIEYDLLVGVPIPVLGGAPCVAAVIEY